jgi:cell division protein FtsB
MKDFHQISEHHVGFAGQLMHFFRRNVYWFLAIGFLLLVLQDVFGIHGVLAMRRSAREAEEIQNDINQLDQENQRLQDKVKELKTDPAAIEKIAREENRLARPGEYIFEIQPKSGGSSRPVSQTADPSKKP